MTTLTQYAGLSEAQQRLYDILDAATEAFNSSSAGGHTQYNFELMVDQTDLDKALELIEALNIRIASE